MMEAVISTLLDLGWDPVAPLHQLNKLAPQVFHPMSANCYEQRTTLEGKQDRMFTNCFSLHNCES